MGIFDKFIEGLRSGLKSDIEELLKADADTLPEKPQELAQNDNIGF